MPGLKREQQKIVCKVDALTKEKDGLLKWMSVKAAKPYTLNVLNEKFEKIELELNDLTHSRWQVRGIKKEVTLWLVFRKSFPLS